MNDAPAYGLWSLALINSAVFIVFAFSFAKPQSKRDWRSFSAFSGFIVALFTERVFVRPLGDPPACQFKHSASAFC